MGGGSGRRRDKRGGRHGTGPRSYPAHASRAQRPLVSPSALERPELDGIVAAAAAERRLTLVVAGAGFGKTTLLARLAATQRTAWYSVDPSDRDVGALAAGIAVAIREAASEFRSDVDEVARSPAPAAEIESLERATGAAHRLVDEIESSLQGELVLVLDEVHQLGDSTSAWRLVETLVRVAPAQLHIVLGSRTEPPFAVERMRGQGEVLDLGGPELAFSPSEIERVLAAVLAAEPADAATLGHMASRIHELTAGWPAAVRLATETLRAAGPGGRDAALERLRAPGGPLFTYLAEEVVAYAAEPVRELVRRMAHFDRFSLALCETLDLEDAERTLAGLARRALFLQPISGAAGWYELHGLVRDFVMAHLPIPPAELADLHRRAATWFLETDQPDAALRSLVASGDVEALGRFLTSRGADLVARGAGRDVAAAIGTLPGSGRDRPLELLLGEANIAVGAWPAAIAALRRAGGTGDRLAAGVAWRLGVIHGLRGAYDEALEVYNRADLEGASPDDETFLFAFTASAHRHHGDATATAASAERALAAALRSGQPRALAAAYAAVGQAREIGNELAAAIEAYERALLAAEEAGDAVQRVRILTAIGSESIDMGRFRAALAALDEAVELSRAIGFAAFQARALAERGRARWWVGQMEEGLADMAAGRDLYARLDAPGRVFALLDEGELHLYRGDLATARTLLESAVRAGRESSDVLLGLCLAELGEAVARDAPDRSRELLEEATAFGRRLDSAPTLSAASYAYLVLGENDLANELATEAEAIAQRSGELPVVALAREVRGRVAGDTATARELFESARDIWTAMGAPFGVALNRLEFARSVSGPEARAAAAEAQRSLQAFGARALAAEATILLADLDQADRPEVSIRTLGGFAVLRSGQSVAPGEWRSKKARDLLKILAARRGRPVPREQLFELLWPDEDPEPLGNRLSVALTTVRSILDPDHRHGSDHFVGSDRGSVWLSMDHVDLDLAAFLADVADGRRLQRAGRAAEALEAFERAEGAYRGSFLEEDLYEDFAVGVRDETQAAYLDAAREVARHANATGDPDTAIRIQLRMLELDAFDERAHVGLIRALIAAGRHGEARRRYGVFAAQMAEIGVEAAPFPSPVPTATAG